MARFSTRDASRIRELDAALATVTEGARSALDWMVPALRDVVGADRSLGFSYRPRGAGVAIDEGCVDRMDPALVPFVDAWVDGKPQDWTLYNPLRPEPSQRNVLVDPWDLGPAAEIAAKPFFSEMYRRFGLADDRIVRVLLCEGASLLAYVGIHQADAFTPRQRRILARLVGPLRRRLSVERLLRVGAGLHAVLLAAIEEISAPAFVTNDQGTVLEVNRVGAMWLATDAAGKRRMLRDAVKQPDRLRERFRVTRVASTGVAPRFLVVCQHAESLEAKCHRAARDWRFSPRETQILGLLCEGLTTRTIAAELGVGERTVGAHLTSMFERAQVESRAELVVTALRRSLS